jgi:hypothetical protein
LGWWPARCRASSSLRAGNWLGLSGST